MSAGPVRMVKLFGLALLPVLASSICPGAHKATPPEDKDAVPDSATYDAALAQLDLKAVISDLKKLMTTTQDCWPADAGHYGPLFVRLAWHCSGSYRENDGVGGCGGGRQRFEPERSWDDNTNLDKARALLWPVKEKYGDGLSWGDLFILAGTTAIQDMGGPVSEYCAGRIDSSDGKDSLLLGPSSEQEKYAPCPINGKCQKPLGSTTIGLIYLNPQGPVEQTANGDWQPNPDPAKSALDVRDAFGRMGMNDSQTVALIGGGHAFGKAHGACPAGAGPAPKDSPTDPWPGKCGSGKGADAFTSGIEGPWTTKPATWDNEYFKVMKDHPWEKFQGPGGAWQWRIPGADGELASLMRLTSDIALLKDQSYAEIVDEFADEPEKLDAAFAEAWAKLTTSGGKWSSERKCIAGSAFPPAMRADDLSTIDLAFIAV
mmetsp:Transcript_24042/g.55868  ORF Transcript_24042/g.55868 Transcript_24042/m.55868 type:complete len:431 (+) Transcript_24042:47-1339(+)|eukprot:CAMPEP_0178437522 /NCGR_PEP_ID=MMETSP0689_2-20121128/35050_1 /TAXON_ID=160604 /ORGANISM="Amphidinium massartii, Strain CS-259" /LENGTH=430 /DNA_ID=CAMNT_0020059755 /DNA_START=46 /DNA_END=1338 /DNA_ORIENTATION=+